MRKLVMLLMITCSALTAACAQSQYVFVSKSGLFFTRYNYSVANVQPPKLGFVSRNWMVDNMHRDENGEWCMNEGERYYGWFMIDRDGDGTLEKERTYIYDLKLKHRQSAAVMWIQSHELGYKESDRALSVMLDRYVGALTGTGLFASSNVFAVHTIKAKSYAARVVQRRESRFHGRKALRAKIALVNLERKRADPSYKGKLLLITLVKIPFDYVHPKYQVRLSGQTVLLVGYYNSFTDYDTAEYDYNRLLKAIQVRRTRSAKR